MNQMKVFLGLSELGKEEGRGGVSDGERAGTPLGAIWDGDTIIVWGLFTDFQTFWWVRRKASCLRARTALFLCLPKPIWRGKQKPSQTSPLLLHLNAPTCWQAPLQTAEWPLKCVEVTFLWTRLKLNQTWTPLSWTPRWNLNWNRRRFTRGRLTEHAQS